MNICFAFNRSGLRCMMPAEHDGPHSHSIEWSDDECWTPDRMGIADGLIPVPGVTPTGAVVPPPLPSLPAPSKARPCEVCEHRMHDGMCPVGNCTCRMGV